MKSKRNIKNNPFMNIKNIAKLVVAIAAMTASTQAVVFTVTPGGEIASGPETSNPTILGIVSGLTGGAPSLYKENVGDGFDSGTYASSYKTTFSNSPTDPADALVEYVSGAPFSESPLYLLVKDGNNEPGWYLFNITAWDRVDDLSLVNFWPGKGAISHIEIFGKQGNKVPDGGATVALLGLGSLALALARRKA
jgi:hypothetical protein